MFESKSGVLFIAGLGFFAFAFLSNALVPIFMFQDIPEQPVLEYVVVGEEDFVKMDDGLWMMKIAKPRRGDHSATLADSRRRGQLAGRSWPSKARHRPAAAGHQDG